MAGEAFPQKLQVDLFDSVCHASLGWIVLCCGTLLGILENMVTVLELAVWKIKKNAVILAETMLQEPFLDLILFQGTRFMLLKFNTIL